MNEETNQKKPDPRWELVDWNKEILALVFKGTTVPVDALWCTFLQGEGVKEFLAKHPEVTEENVIRVLETVFRFFEDWPEARKEQEVLINSKDPRLLVAESRVGYMGGALVFPGTKVLVTHLWDGLKTDTFKETLQEDWIPAFWARSALHLGAVLFAKGLEKDAK